MLSGYFGYFGWLPIANGCQWLPMVANGCQWLPMFIHCFMNFDHSGQVFPIQVMLSGTLGPCEKFELNPVTGFPTIFRRSMQLLQQHQKRAMEQDG